VPPIPQLTLITGSLGIGKTTVMAKIAQRLAHRAIAGFLTEEIREEGKRVGFLARTLAGTTCALARVGEATAHRVGRYGVNVDAFERLILPELARKADLILIDEIGKMECFSNRFVEAMRRLLQESVPVVATVALRGSGFIAEVKRHPGAWVLTITRENRDELPVTIIRSLEQMPGRPSNRMRREAGPWRLNYPFAAGPWRRDLVKIRRHRE